MTSLTTTSLSSICTTSWRRASRRQAECLLTCTGSNTFSDSSENILLKTSRLSLFDRRIEGVELNPCVGRRESPVHPDHSLVPVLLPGGHLPPEPGHRPDPPVQALL